MDIHLLVDLLADTITEESPIASDELGRIGTPEVVQAMVDLLKHNNPESRFMAARTLSLIENNDAGLMPLLDAIEHKDNKDQAGNLMAWLENFDLSDHYIAIFKLYLFGGHKVSVLAKGLLDFESFNISARVLKKATKHWKHYTNNVKQDELYDLKKTEVDAILSDLRIFIER